MVRILGALPITETESRLMAAADGAKNPRPEGADEGRGNRRVDRPHLIIDAHAGLSCNVSMRWVIAAVIVMLSAPRGGENSDLSATQIGRDHP